MATANDRDLIVFIFVLFWLISFAGVSISCFFYVRRIKWPEGYKSLKVLVDDGCVDKTKKPFSLYEKRLVMYKVCKMDW